MTTGKITSWTGNPLDIGPLYPFVGWEMPLFLLCFALWFAYTVWQLKFESATYSAELEEKSEDRD